MTDKQPSERAMKAAQAVVRSFHGDYDKDDALDIDAHFPGYEELRAFAQKCREHGKCECVQSDTPLCPRCEAGAALVVAGVEVDHA